MNFLILERCAVIINACRALYVWGELYLNRKIDDFQLFGNNAYSTSPTINSSWDISHYETINKWKIKPYKWSNIVGTNDAIEKSQQSLIDMIRYFEGDADNNYKAKERYVDLNGKGTKTYGYGITQLPKKLGKLNPPSNEKEAYVKTNEQVAFNFDVVEEQSPVLDRLDEIDPLKVTPMDAINLLYELKELSKK